MLQYGIMQAWIKNPSNQNRRYERDMKQSITKDMSILDVVQLYPDTAEVFMNAGMGCLGCAAAHFENIEQGALAHGIDVDALIKGLNECIGAEPEASAN
jgi:hybrid cluster-associated redox disulfide protein